MDIPNPEPKEFGVFGWSVAAVENRLIIGSMSADANGLPSSGAVYVYEMIPEPHLWRWGLTAVVGFAVIEFFRRFISASRLATSSGIGSLLPVLRIFLREDAGG